MTTTTTNNDATDASVRPYVVQYAITYLAACFAVSTLDQLVGLSSGWMVANAVAMVVPSYSFVRDHGRPFSSAEQLRFSLWAVLATFLVPGGLVAALSPEMFADLTKDVPSLVLALGLVGLPAFAMLHFVSGAMTRSVARHRVDAGS